VGGCVYKVFSVCDLRTYQPAVSSVVLLVDANHQLCRSRQAVHKKSRENNGFDVSDLMPHSNQPLFEFGCV